jgi:hypothetical protein
MRRFNKNHANSDHDISLTVTDNTHRLTRNSARAGEQWRESEIPFSEIDSDSHASIRLIERIRILARRDVDDKFSIADRCLKIVVSNIAQVLEKREWELRVTHALHAMLHGTLEADFAAIPRVSFRVTFQRRVVVEAVRN